MPNTLGNNLQLCFFKLKRQSSRPESPTIQSPHDRPSSASSSSSSSSSFIGGGYKTFNSLYDPTSLSDYETPLFSASISQSLTLTTTSSPSDSTSDSDDLISTTSDPDLITAIASRRFSLPSPGRSNSIVDSAAVAFGDGLFVPTYSPDPKREFKRSMVEMAAALGLVDTRRHWDRLHELLLCYLALNGKHAHKYIVGAFADLLVDLGTEEFMGRRRS